MDDFQEQVRIWMEGKDYYCPDVNWGISASQNDNTSCDIRAELSVIIQGINTCTLSCNCSTANNEDSIRGAVEAMSEKILHRLSIIEP